ncbi:MAG TPA: hypothetical protein VJ841_00680 [Candidatus Saccharimonadales bacterium]|nr:hypothetical protein [Candidatus Saccharimonadales bacterium]
MSHPNTKTFYEAEAAPIFKQLKGPVESFTVKGEQELLVAAVENGIIPSGAFRDCAVLNDEAPAEEQKTLRYEAKRALEIRTLLQEEEAPSLDDKMVGFYIDQTMARATLVEGARKAIREGEEGTLTERHARLYNEAIDAAQKELFPQPNLRIAAYAASLVYRAAEKADPPQAHLLLEKYPFLQTDIEGETILSEETRSEWYSYLHEKYDPIFLTVRARLGDTKLSNASSAEATRLFMEEAGFPIASETAEGWRSIKDEEAAGFKVEPDKRMIISGRRKTELTWPVFERLMLHEVEVHARRAENGYKKGYDALQNGLPGYQESEEGFGLLLENLWSGTSPDVLGRDHYRYLTVCYAAGILDGHVPTETESLAFVSDLIASKQSGGLTDEAMISAARKNGFDHVKRAFRGMPEGKVMLSNLAYLSGKLKMMTFLEGSDMPPAELLLYMQQGKIDPTNAKHMEIMTEVNAA